jgi:uncharacterized protein YdaT
MLTGGQIVAADKVKFQEDTEVFHDVIQAKCEQPETQTPIAHADNMTAVCKMKQSDEEKARSKSQIQDVGRDRLPHRSGLRRHIQEKIWL